jgi:hypothetical protein
MSEEAGNGATFAASRASIEAKRRAHGDRGNGKTAPA